jgi:bifunctional pyridoxal-dependent enzyme with beta-cystathionase and maltose regulon repressor activities
LLFCSPSNPTGSVYSVEQVKAIGEWALKNNIWIIADEIYEHLLYDGATAPSMPVLVPGLADTTIILNVLRPSARQGGGLEPTASPATLRLWAGILAERLA